MKVLRVVLLIAFALAVLVSVDLGIQFAGNLVPSMNDGLGMYSMLHAVFDIFDGAGWTLERFYRIFVQSLGVTTVLFVANVAVWVAAILRRNER